MNYYIPKYFKIEELVDPVMLKRFGSYNLFKNALDSRILFEIDNIRTFFNKPITINNWNIGGEFSLRGLRPFDCKEGGLLSAHKFGKALDFDVKGLTAEEVRQAIIKNSSKFINISRMEDNVSWVHIDCVNINKTNGIELFTA